MPKIGGRRKKARSQKQGEGVDQDNGPKTFVFKIGKCTQTCRDLALDFRKCFYPNTAMKLQDSNKIAIKSYLRAAKHYQVTHLIAFQQSKQKTYARFIKVGGGQILFRIINYCRMKEIVKNGGQPFNFSLKEPLIVLNNFTENNQVRQIGRSIQEMFPSINVDKINLSVIKRVLSFTYQPNKKCIYFRHYKIIIKEGGVDNSFKQLTKNIHSDMSQFRSFAQFLQNVKAKQNGEQHQTRENQRQVKLVEIGPRLKLKFVSFKQGFGKVESDQEQQQMQKSQKQQNNNHEVQNQQDESKIRKAYRQKQKIKRTKPQENQIQQEE